MEQPISPPAEHVTEQEYLRREESAKSRHEYRNARIVDMAGGTSEHASIAMNLGVELATRLKGGPCKVFGSDLSVRVSRSGNYYYPDLMVACGALEYAWPDRRTTITNPRVVIEVTSPSSEVGDRGEKFSDYRHLDSLEEYVLVSQERMQVETFYRQPDGLWVIGPTVTQSGQAAKFRSLEIEIPLNDIYAGVELPPKQAV